MIQVELTIEEAENIVMMYEFCKRWYSHSYAVNAIAKVSKALRERPQQSLFDAPRNASNEDEIDEK